MLEVGLTATCTTMSWPVEMPPRMPPALLRENPCGVISSECSVPFCATAREARADLDALHRVDAHHVLRDVGVELVVDRLAPADRHAASRPRDARADRIAGLAQPVHERLELGDVRAIGDEERIVVDVVPRS